MPGGIRCGSHLGRQSPNSLYGGFSAVHVVIRNLDVRTYDNPGIGGIDLRHALQCRLENVFVNTGVYNVQASQPTHGTNGLITPANNNAALTILRNVVVTGYHTGIVVNEHTDGDNIVVGSNIHGLGIRHRQSCLPLRPGGRLRNTHHVTVTGKHGFSIEQLDIENAGTGQTDTRNAWQTTVQTSTTPTTSAPATYSRRIINCPRWILISYETWHTTGTYSPEP